MAFSTSKGTDWTPRKSDRDLLDDLVRRVAALKAAKAQGVALHTHLGVDERIAALVTREEFESYKRHIEGVLDALMGDATFTTSRKPLTLVVGGQYRTQDGKCIPFEESGLFHVWHEYGDEVEWHTPDGKCLNRPRLDIIGPWEDGE